MLEINTSLGSRCASWVTWYVSKYNLQSRPWVPFMIWVKPSLLLQFLFLELSEPGSLSWKTILPLEGQRTLVSTRMKRSIVKDTAGSNPWLWLPSQAARVNCENVNETREVADAHVPLQSKSHQQIPPIETSGTSWIPGDEDTSTHSHMPPVRPIVFTKAYDSNRVVCCFLQWLYGTEIFFSFFIRTREMEFLILY